MVRNIEYRGKRDSGEWVYGGLCYRHGHHPCISVLKPDTRTDNTEILENKWNVYVDVYEDTIGQSTDLKDKKGVTIYEGDILGLGFRSRDSVRYQEKGIVVWHLGGLYVKDETYTDPHPIGNFLLNKIEVVGNIFDNPELIPNIE